MSSLGGPTGASLANQTPPPKAKMGKKKSDIYSCFQILPMKNKANKSIFMCRFCDRQYLQNATKMESHIVTQCQKVPPAVRLSYAKVPGGGPRSNNNSTPSPSNSDSRPQTPVNLSMSMPSNQRNSQGNLQRNSSNNIVIKRAGGTLVAHQIPSRNSNQNQNQSQNSELFQRNHVNSNANSASNANKRPRLAEGVNLNNNLHHQLKNYNLNNSMGNGNNNHNNSGSSGSSNNHYNYVQRQQQVNNHKRVVSSAAVGKQLNSFNSNNANSVGRPRLTASASAVSNSTESSQAVDQKEMANIWRLLAKGIYATGCPLTILKNEYWVEAFKRIRPGLTLPSLNALSTTLLKEEYERVEEDIHALIAPRTFVTRQCESHPGLSPDEHILSFIVTTPSPLLYRTLTVTSADLSTKETLASAISSTIDSIGSEKVLAFISDLSPAMKCSWDTLRSKYPGLLTFGCILQGLNALLNEFMDSPSIRDLCQKGKAIVDRTRGSSGLKKKFQEIQKQLKLAPVPAFKFSSKSKWSSLVKVLTLLISQKAAFAQLLGSEEAREDFELQVESDNQVTVESLVELTQNEDFWTGMDAVTKLIVPLSNWIKRVEVESSPSISFLPQLFHELKAAFEANLGNLPLEPDLKEHFLKQLQQTRRLCMNELHLAAALLNPKVKAKGILSPDEEEEGSEFIHYFCETRDLDAQSSLKELQEYRNKVGAFSKPNIWKLAETKEPSDWWDSVRPGSALGTVANHLLAISPPLSTFDPKSVYGKVPLSPGLENDKARVDKLAFIYYHLQTPKTNREQALPPPPPLIPKVQLPMQNHKEWSPQPDFKLEDHEPMDVTQFLSQSNHQGIYTDSEEEEDSDYDSKNNNTSQNHNIANSNVNNIFNPATNSKNKANNNNKNQNPSKKQNNNNSNPTPNPNPNSILSSLIRGLPTDPEEDEEEEEADEEVLNNAKNDTENNVDSENLQNNLSKNNNILGEEEDSNSSSSSDGSSSSSSSDSEAGSPEKMQL